MARILCVTSGLAGLLYSSLELAHRLQTAGHEVIYASFPDVEQAVNDHALRFLPLAPSQYDDFIAADSAKGLVTRFLTIGDRRKQAARALAVAGVADTVRGVDPDLILIDGEMHEQIIAASQTEVPMALLVPFVSIWRRPGLPPPHHLVRPGVGWRGTTVGITLLWWNLRLRKFRTTMRQAVSRLGCDRVSILRRLAQEVGFDFRGETDFGQWLIPFTYRRIPALCTHALEFEFPHLPREGVHYLGPLVLQRRIDHRVTDEIRARIDAIASRCREAGRERILIYAGFGSFYSTDDALVRRLVAAVAERDDWELVISLGGRDISAALGPLPANAHAFPWVPQMDVLRLANVAVIHGGIGTVDECVVSGVPMLVYCGFETDMGGTTARVWHHGIGIVGDRDQDNPSAIRTQIERLLTEPCYRRNVERLRETYAAYSRSRVVERVIESLLNDSRSPTDDPQPTTPGLMTNDHQ